MNEPNWLTPERLSDRIWVLKVRLVLPAGEALLIVTKIGPLACASDQFCPSRDISIVTKVLDGL
jgi:hypothetical protein